MRALVYWTTSEFYFFVKLLPDEGIDNPQIGEKNTITLVLWIFFLSDSKRITKELVYAVDGFKSNMLSYTENVSFCIEKIFSITVRK